MKELTQEVTKKEIIGYQADDGRVFHNEEECRKYEETSNAVIRANFERLVVGETNEYRLFGMGCEDNRIALIEIDNMNDVINANMYGQMMTKDNILDQSYIGKRVLVGTGYQHDWCHVYGTKEEVLEKIKQRIEKELESHEQTENT